MQVKVKISDGHAESSMELKKQWRNAFTLDEGGHRPLSCATKGAQGSPRLIKWGLTLAEVLITLGVIGVVAAVTLPTLVTNIQERVRKEQVRTVKYKLTKATDKMNSLGKIGAYPTTIEFVNELKNHLSIAKICKNNELDKCWPTESINAYQNGSSTLTSFPVKNLKQGVDLKALALGTKTTDTVGIVTGDGVPMLLVYSPVCSGFDEAKTYTWSVQDGKPVTNATTNCVSAIFDINGSKGPNKIGQDVRTLNSLFGSTDLNVVTGITSEQCSKVNTKYGINNCCTSCDANGGDTWAAGVIACADLGLHLPDMMTLANIANARYGTTQIGAYTLYIKNNPPEGQTCKEYFTTSGIWGDATYRANNSDAIICGANLDTDPNSALNADADSTATTISGGYWSNSEISDTSAYERPFGSDFSAWYRGDRTLSYKSLCVGD